MNEEKVIEVFRNIEHEQGTGKGVQFDMSHWLLVDAGLRERRSPNAANVCHTTACFAGHALINEGFKVDYVTEQFRDDEGSRVDTEEKGAEILGLTRYEADDLFYLDTLDEVYEWCAEKMGVTVGVLRDKVTG